MSDADNNLNYTINIYGPLTQIEFIKSILCSELATLNDNIINEKTLWQPIDIDTKTTHYKVALYNVSKKLVTFRKILFLCDNIDDIDMLYQDVLDFKHNIQHEIEQAYHQTHDLIRNIHDSIDVSEIKRKLHNKIREKLQKSLEHNK